MGLLNKLWSGADFWDKKENKQQRDQFAQQDEERKKREAEARAQKQAQQQAAQAQRDAQRKQAPTVVSPTVTPVKQPTFGPQVPNQPEVIQQLFKPLQTTPNPILTPPPTPAPPKLNKFGNPEPVRGRENGQDGTYYTGAKTGKRTFIPDPVKEDKSTWGKIKRGLGIAKDTAQGTVGAIPQVGLAAGRTATGLVQGAGQLPHMATATLATGTEKLADAWSNPVTRQVNRGFQDLNTGVKTATHYAIDDTFDPINRNLDHASQMYARTVQGSEDVGKKNYEQTQVGLNVLAALLTLGASSAATGASGASKVGQAGRAGEIATGASKPGKMAQVMEFLNKPIAGSSDDIISKIGGGATDKLASTANALNAPFGTTKNELLKIFGGNAAKSEALDAAATGAKAVNTATPTVKKPNEVAPGVKSTNTTPEVRKPEPVVRPEPVKPTKPVKNEVPQVVKEAPSKPVVPKSTDETLAGLKGRRESLAAERDDLLTNGGDVKDVERQIKSIDNAIKEHTTPPKTPEAKVLAEGDQQLAEATTVKPVKTVQQVNEPNPNALPIKPSNGDVITDHEALAESARKYDSIAEWRDKTNTNLIDGNGRMTDPVTGENISAKQFFDNAKANAPDTAPTQVDSMFKDEAGVTRKTSTGEVLTKPEAKAEGVTQPKSKKMTQAQKDQLEIDRANSVRKAEGQDPLPSKPEKAPKTVKSEKVDVAQSEPTPVKPTKSELQKGAADNTTKSGKVSQKWINKQVKDGADADELRSAIEKVEGPKAPSKPIKEKPVASGGIPLDGKQGVGKHGDIYDTTSQAVNEAQGKQTLKKTGERKFLDKMEKKVGDGEAFTPADRNAAKRLLDKGAYPDGSEAQMLLNSIVVNVNKDAAQVLATAHRLHRATASEDDLINRLIQRTLRMTDNQVKLTADDLADVRARTKAFVDARVEFNKAQEAFYKSGSPEDQVIATKAALKKQRLDKEQKIAELNAIAGKQGDRAAKKEMYKLIDKLGKEADVWQMDYVDTGLLSTTGTWVANIVNSIGGGVEEALFGKLGAKFANFKTGTTSIGGGNAFSANAQKFGFRKLWDEAKNRTQLPSKNIADRGMNYLKNFVTTMNEIGNTQIDAGAHAAVSAEYRNLLRSEYPSKFGSKMTKEAKKELDRLVEYNALVDPRDIKQKYIDYGFKVQGMAAVLGKAGKTNAAKLENRMASGISNFLRAGDKNPMPKGLADAVGKLTMRVTIGFPTIVARSAGQGMRRVTGGAPTFLQARFTQDPVEKAMLIKQGIKEMGSGAAMVSAGAVAGQSGMITGAYPTDKITQDEWAKEGKSEWSIKVGDSYYGLPRMLGPFAIPFLVGAQMGENNASGDGIFQADAIKQMANSVAKSYDATMPAGQISDNIETITNLAGLFSEDENEQKKANAALSKFAGNALRIGAVPLSGMLNQITQSTTDTQKDTKGDGGIVEPIISYVMSGLPGLNQKLADKTSNDGTVLTTTDPVARLFGAQSTENKAGVADNKQQVEDNQNDLSPIIKDKNIYDLLEPETQKLLDQTQDPKSKKRLNDQNLETIYKDVSKTTEKLASEGKWGSYGNTLKVKLNTQKADKKSTPEEQALTQRQVTQADILDKHGIDPKVFALYDLSAEKGGVSASDFKKMIDPEDEYYDMDTAQALWKLDKLFTEAGVSGNNTGAIDPWTKQKYSMPKDKNGSGSGGKKDKGIATDFGTIGAFAKPPAGNLSQKYQKLTNSGAMPNLTASSSKTNLRKNISVVKGVRL